MTEVATTNGNKPAVGIGRRQGDLDQTFRLAQALAQSALLPQQFRGKPSDVLVCILYGEELGIAAMQAMQSIYVVQGRPTISAQLWVALARRAGHKVRVIEETDEQCTVEVARADDPDYPTRVTYTYKQATKAGLTTKDVWKSHPASMLYARAVATACRRACPEIALGFGDETEAQEAQPKRPTLGQVAAQREQPAQPEPEPQQADEPVDAEIVEPTPEGDGEADMLADLADLEAEHAQPEGDNGALWFEGGDDQ